MKCFLYVNINFVPNCWIESKNIYNIFMAILSSKKAINNSLIP